jgi:hypothetical protein
MEYSADGPGTRHRQARPSRQHPRARPDAIERGRGDGRGLTSQLAVGVSQLRFDRSVDVAVDVVGPDAVDDPVSFQDGENLWLYPR